MAIPTGKRDVYELVERWYTRLTSLNVGASDAQSQLATNSAPVVYLYQRILGFQNSVTDLQALALPIETMVLIIEEKYRIGQAAVSALLTDYVAIRDDIVPPLKTWIETNSASLNGNLQASPGLVLPALSAELQGELAVHLTSLLAKFD